MAKFTVLDSYSYSVINEKSKFPTIAIEMDGRNDVEGYEIAHQLELSNGKIWLDSRRLIYAGHKNVKQNGYYTMLISTLDADGFEEIY